MTRPPAATPASSLRMAEPFPQPGPRTGHAYYELHIAATGTKEQREALGDPRKLPRPWDPPSCPPELRAEIWAWLDAVVAWLNSEYTWVTSDLVPACWPRHPHLVHELAVVADQRRLAGLALTSEPMEDWHRYCLPTFIDHMRNRLGAGCDEAHQPTPGKARQRRHAAEETRQLRQGAYRDDRAAGDEPDPRTGGGRRLQVVDTTTGEVLS